MKHRITLATLLALGMPGLSLASTPFVVEQTYWLKHGRTDQFISLFKKTRLPALQAEAQAGRLLLIRMAQPQLMSDKDQWDFRITLAWKDRESALQFSARQPNHESQRRAMEEQLREELVLERNEVLVIEESL